MYYRDQPFEDVYVKPWIRIGPYVVGLFTGYILYRTKCKVKMHKVGVTNSYIVSYKVILHRIVTARQVGIIRKW